ARGHRRRGSGVLGRVVRLRSVRPHPQESQFRQGRNPGGEMRPETDGRCAAELAVFPRPAHRCVPGDHETRGGLGQCPGTAVPGLPSRKLLMLCRFLFTFTLTLFAFSSSAFAADWKPAPAPLMTKWGKQVTPDNAWKEYPRPQLVRTDWLNLNGLWDYAIT